MRGRGRPPKLDRVLAIEIAALLLVGRSTSDVAQMTGVSRRAISGWRRRAWSRAEGDAACVLLEQTLSRGRAAIAAGIGARDDVPGTSSRSLDDLLADLDRSGL